MRDYPQRIIVSFCQQSKNCLKRIYKDNLKKYNNTPSQHFRSVKLILIPKMGGPAN